MDARAHQKRFRSKRADRSEKFSRTRSYNQQKCHSKRDRRETKTKKNYSCFATVSVKLRSKINATLASSTQPLLYLRLLILYACFSSLLIFLGCCRIPID